MNEIDTRLAGYCRARGLEGVVLRRRSNMAWVTGGADFHCDTATSGGIATLVWTPTRKRVFTDTIEAARLRDEEPLSGWEVEALDWWAADARAAELVKTGKYATDWPDDPFYELRASLTAQEIERARQLGKESAEVVERLMKNDVKPGMTEFHLGGAVAGWLRDRGIFGHVVLIAADERIAKYRHPIPTAKAIRSTAMVAICAQRHGLIVSLTRLVHFGPMDAELRRKHNAVVGVDNALHKASVAGARWCDVLAAGVKEYERSGFGDEWKKHHQGGPMGYECRDFKATPAETRTVQANQLIGWNPSITGTKSEDTILATATGAENIARTGQWPELHGRPDILVRSA